MLADAGAPAVLSGASHAVMLADAGAPAVVALAPLCARTTARGAGARTAGVPASASITEAPCVVRSPAASASPFSPRLPPPPSTPSRRPASPPCCRQPAPRGTRVLDPLLLPVPPRLRHLPRLPLSLCHPHCERALPPGGGRAADGLATHGAGEGRAARRCRGRAPRSRSWPCDSRAWLDDV